MLARILEKSGAGATAASFRDIRGFARKAPRVSLQTKLCTSTYQNTLRTRTAAAAPSTQNRPKALPALYVTKRPPALLLQRRAARVLRAAAATTEEAPVNPSRTYSNARRRRRRAPHTPRLSTPPSSRPSTRPHSASGDAPRPHSAPPPVLPQPGRAAAGDAPPPLNAPPLNALPATPPWTSSGLPFGAIRRRDCLQHAAARERGPQSRKRKRIREHPTLARTQHREAQQTAKNYRSAHSKKLYVTIAKPTSRSLVEVGLSRNPPSKVDSDVTSLR